MSKQKEKFTINGKEVKLKEKYTLSDWGKILKFFSMIKNDNETEMVIQLLAENMLVDFLNLILDKETQIEGDVYEDDFPQIMKITNSFFLRKGNLIDFSKRNTKN